MGEKDLRSRLLICTSKIVLMILALTSIVCLDVKSYAAEHRLEIVVNENATSASVVHYDGQEMFPAEYNYYPGPFDIYLTYTPTSVTPRPAALAGKMVELYCTDGSVIYSASMAELYSQYSTGCIEQLVMPNFGAGYRFVCNSREQGIEWIGVYYILRVGLIRHSIPISPTVDTAVAASISTSTPTVVTGAETVTPHEHNWVFKTIYEPTEEADGLEGECCECGAVRNTSTISAADFLLNNKYKQIESAQIGQNVVLDMKWMHSLSNAFMRRLAQKNSNSYTIRLTYDKKQYEIYIPQGAVYDTSLKYYGPKKLMEMFEYKQLN